MECNHAVHSSSVHHRAKDCRIGFFSPFWPQLVPNRTKATYHSPVFPLFVNMPPKRKPGRPGRPGTSLTKGTTISKRISAGRVPRPVAHGISPLVRLSIHRYNPSIRLHVLHLYCRQTVLSPVSRHWNSPIRRSSTRSTRSKNVMNNSRIQSI